MILPGQRRAATIAISRYGTSCVVSEPTGSTATDGYGKSDIDSTFAAVGTESVVQTYGSRSSNPAQSRHTGGRLPADSPLLVFRHDSVIEPGYRVNYDGNEYEVDSLTEYPTHLEASTTLVS